MCTDTIGKKELIKTFSSAISDGSSLQLETVTLVPAELPSIVIVTVNH